MNAKKEARLRRARRTRAKIRELGIVRLCVNRTPRHIYAQLINANGDKVLVTASSLDKTLHNEFGGNIETASKVGALLAERAAIAGITTVAFDRSGFKYHGRIKALAESARQGGLQF